MNRQEMLERLANGKKPIDVSIQKWRDIVQSLRDGVKPAILDISVKTCALCEDTTGNNGLKQCHDCYYYAFYGFPCFYNAYDEFDKAAQNNDVDTAIEGAWDMIAELEKVKKWIEGA